MKVSDQVLKTIRDNDLIDQNQHIVLGLSGGPDSVCLFHVLMSLVALLKITVHPVHVNHRFRPVAAERDQKYVEELCERAGAPCRSFVVDCNALAKELSMTSEEAGRKARYDAFGEVAAEIAAQLVQKGMDECEARKSVKIAVAHNADDQAETVLFRLLRGTGIDGLAGMAYSRREGDFAVIRPLLDVCRSDIEDYCSKQSLKPAIDHTNSETTYTRNKIRLKLIPMLEKEYNENIQETLVRLSRSAAEDKDFLWNQVEEIYARLADKKNDSSGSLAEIVMPRAELAALHGAVRHRLIMRAFADIGLEQDVFRERIEAADSIIAKKQAPKTVQFPRGYRLTVAKGRVVFCSGERSQFEN